MKIINEIARGIGPDSSAAAILVPDRKTATETPIAQARPFDIVVIAGRGHETTEQVGSSEVPLLDSDVALNALRSRYIWQRPGELRTSVAPRRNTNSQKSGKEVYEDCTRLPPGNHPL